jgi:hypothetical protein
MQQVMGKQRFPLQFDTSFLIAALIVPIVHFCLGYIGLSMTFVNGASVFWPSLGVFFGSDATGRLSCLANFVHQ